MNRFYLLVILVQRKQGLGCLKLFITNSSGSFQNTTTVVSDVHKIIATVCKYYFQNSKPKKIV